MNGENMVQTDLKMDLQMFYAADVVIRGKDVAIALYYRRDVTEAPIIAAIGTGLYAKSIVNSAEKLDISLVENDWLAASLFANHREVREHIAPELYQPIAEILAVIYIDKRKGGTKGKNKNEGILTGLTIFNQAAKCKEMSEDGSIGESSEEWFGFPALRSRRKSGSLS